MASTPSAKRVHLEPVAPSHAVNGLDVRGSFQRAASTEFEDDIRMSATNARFHVARGGPVASSSSRSMKRFQTAPELTFGTQSTNTVFTTASHVIQSVYGSPSSRSNEVQPMYLTNHGSLVSNPLSVSPASPLMSSAASQDGRSIYSDTSSLTLFGTIGPTDGFDAEMALDNNNDSNVAQVPSEAFKGNMWVPQQVRSGKRQTMDGDDDDDDDDGGGSTDVEDQDEMADVVLTLPHSIPGRSSLIDQMNDGTTRQRPLAGRRRAFQKTQSLPADLFTTSAEF